MDTGFSTVCVGLNRTPEPQRKKYKLRTYPQPLPETPDVEPEITFIELRWEEPKK